MTDLVIRPLATGEEALFESLPDPGLVGFAAFGDTYSGMAAAGEYRPEWTWVALRDGVVVARAAWWAGPKDDKPVALDWFDFTDAGAAVQLLRDSPLQAEYSLELPPGRRGVPAVREQAQARIDAAVAAGMSPLVERFRYRWTPDCGVPARPGRLEFRPEPDDAAILDVFRRIHQGSLDAHVRRTVAASGPEVAAREELDCLRWLPSPREWWRLAYNPAGELVGLSVPARNYGDPLIGYIGVVPEYRGHGYAYDLLVEATHKLADEGVDRIVAGTDRTNVPMAAHFARVGYPIAQERIDLIWPGDRNRCGARGVTTEPHSPLLRLLPGLPTGELRAVLVVEFRCLRAAQGPQCVGGRRSRPTAWLNGATGLLVRVQARPCRNVRNFRRRVLS